LGVCLSLPAVIGREGVVRTVKMVLSKEEEKKLEDSAKVLRDMIEGK
jgi:L-lactate dehydrogenase